jgi:hypothetical protein
MGTHFSIFYPEEAKQRQWPQHELEVASETGALEDGGWRVKRTERWDTRAARSLICSCVSDNQPGCKDLRGHSGTSAEQRASC